MKNYIQLFLLLLVITVKAQVVNNTTELQNAVNNAQAGTVMD